MLWPCFYTGLQTALPDDIAVSNPRGYRPPLPVGAYGSHAPNLILMKEKKWRTCALICSHSRAHQTSFSERGKRPSIKEEDSSVFAHRAPAEHYARAKLRRSIRGELLGLSGLSRASLAVNQDRPEKCQAQRRTVTPPFQMVLTCRFTICAASACLGTSCCICKNCIYGRG